MHRRNRLNAFLIILIIGFILYITISLISQKSPQEVPKKEIQSEQKSLKIHPLDFEIHQQQTQDIITGKSSIPSINIINCGKFPLESDLNITDIYWQVTKTSNVTIYIYNAYFDDRGPSPNIRIISLINILNPSIKTFCQFWYENVTEPIISNIHEYRYIWNKNWGFNKKGASPYLMSCNVPKSLPSPKFVSIVDKKCGNANNLLKIKNKRMNVKDDFIVAVKRFEYADDISIKIIEWTEILKILGINKIDFFVHYIHPNVLNVLKYYESIGFMNIKFIKYPSDIQHDRKQNWHQYSQNQLISYHDTFYENIYSYNFMIPMDIDEFIMPLRHEDRTLMDLLNRTKNGYDCYTVDNHYFLLESPKQKMIKIKDIPKNLHFLHNIFRAANFTPNSGNAKTFMRMDRVLTVHNHFPFSCIDETNDYKCRRYQIDRNDGQLSHYRINCGRDECIKSFDDPVRDVSLWKFKDKILENVKDVIERIRDYTNGELDIKLDYDT